MRFNKRIAFEVVCSENCMKKEIPAIILQPLVENALSHGLKNCRQGGKVQVQIFQEGEDVVMEVADNGEGISQEQIVRIEEKMKKPFDTGERGIGLRSVAYRLNYLFGDRASLHLRSREHRTATTIRVPAD